MAQETNDGVPISDGFDFPVGARGANADVFKTHKVDTILVDPDYFKSLGYWHSGEDWNGRGGGDSDLGDPIFAISSGRVVDFGYYSVWGNIVLLEHALPDNTRVWSQYAHLKDVLVTQKGQKVTRGQQIGTMGKGDKDRYIAHLHFEIRKTKLSISNWSPMVKNRDTVLANYYNPTEFIKTHRSLTVPTQPTQPTTPQPTSPSTPQPKAVSQLVLNSQMTNPQAGVGLFAKANVDNWFTGSKGYQGKMLWTYASTQEQSNWAEWRPTLSESGNWHVWVFIPAENATSTYVRYIVSHKGGKTEVPVNQGGNRNQWVNLGSYNFAPGQGYLRLSDVTGELTTGTPLKIGFDAVCWTKAS